MLFSLAKLCELVGEYQRFGETYVSTFSPKDTESRSMFLLGVDIYPQVHTALQLKDKHRHIYCRENLTSQ
jgi:hypothetical protein